MPRGGEDTRSPSCGSVAAMSGSSAEQLARSIRRHRALAIGVAMMCTATACSSAGTDSTTGTDDVVVDATADENGARASGEGQDTDDQDLANQDTGGSSVERPSNCDEVGDRSSDDGYDSVQLEEIGETDEVSVSAALYPLADTEGNPWSQWGSGVVLPDGRFVSAVGDHLGRDGTSWIYEYDPDTRTLTRTTEVSEALGHAEGDWGYGKVHAPLLLSECGDVIGATYWGTRRDLELGGSYNGDQFFRYDPNTREIEPMGVPVEGYGLPSIALSPDKQWIFAEAVDPESEPDAGVFVVADATTGEVVSIDENPDHVGFRSILVTPDGEGLYAVPGASVVAVDPSDGSTRLIEDVLPGDWLRTASPISPDGSVYGATRDPDALFGRDATGSFSDLGEVEDYVASLGLSPDGSTIYYVPGAHGNGPEFGTPLIAVDTATGERTELVRLNDLIEGALEVRAGGTYNVVADPSGKRVYVGLNAGPIDDDEDAFGQVVLAVVELE